MRIVWSVAVVTAALTMAGCSDDTPTVCQEREQVLATLQELGDYDLVADGVDGFEALVDELVGNVDDLRAAASDEVSAEVEAVSTAIADSRAAVSDAATAQDALAALQTGTADIRDAVETLSSSLPECG
jgi:outer membrane murein-binding lipoprotein Lpp